MKRKGINVDAANREFEAIEKGIPFDHSSAADAVHDAPSTPATGNRV